MATGSKQAWYSNGGDWGIQISYEVGYGTFRITQILGYRSNYRSNGNLTLTISTNSGTSNTSQSDTVTAEFSKATWGGSNYWQFQGSGQSSGWNCGHTTVSGISVSTLTVTLKTTNVFNSYINNATWTFYIDMPTYTITYNNNYGSGGPSSQAKVPNANLTLSSSIPSRTGFTFSGWSETQTATSATWAAGGTYTYNRNATLYAVYTPINVPSLNLSSSNITENSIDITSNTTSTLSYAKDVPVFFSNLPIKVLSDSSVWARIYSHDSRAGSILWSTSSEALNTQTSYKYSRLNLLTDNNYNFKGIDNKYEFMLLYPTDAPGEYNRWKQTYAPQEEYITPTSTGDGTATGYDASYTGSHIDWTVHYWGGMTRQNSSATDITNCYLSGSVGHTNWYYALAPSIIYNMGVPCINSQAGRIVELWVRLPGITGSTIALTANQSRTILNLEDDSIYTFCATSSNNGGPGYSSTIQAITLKGQAKTWIKYNGDWVKSFVWTKYNGTWYPVKKAFIKDNDTWYEGV